MSTNSTISYRRYSKDEINFIIKNYTGEKQNLIDIAHKLNRSPGSIQYQAFKHNLTNKIQRKKLGYSYTLTNKEKEVLDLLYKGYSVKEIANELFISVTTVKTHKTNILFKKDVNSVTELLSKRIAELENQIITENCQNLTDLQKLEIVEFFIKKLKTDEKENRLCRIKINS